MRRWMLTTLVVASTLVIAGAVSPMAAPVASATASAALTAHRVAGADRYATAVAVSRAAFAAPIPEGTVVLASGVSFADEMAAGPVATVLGGPLLLTRTSSLPAPVAAELTRLQPRRVIVLGPTETVSAAVETAVRRIVPQTTRLAGTDQHETAAAAIGFAFPAGSSHAYLAASRMSDALGAATLAAAHREPMIPIVGTAPALSAGVVNLLRSLGTSSVTIVGGTAAVPTQTRRELEILGLRVTRLAGADRDRTTALVARHTPSSGAGILVAPRSVTHESFSATVLAARLGMPLMLSGPLCAGASVRAYAATHRVTEVTLIGRSAQLRSLVAKLVPCRSTTSAGSPWVMVDKRHPLSPRAYRPGDLRSVRLSGGYPMRSEAAAALERLSAAVHAAGHGTLGVASAFRPYGFQQSLYANYASAHGRAWADRASARAGYSEHQTGLAADVVACAPWCGTMDTFGRSATGRWVKANAWRYGFIVRYEPGQTKVTGYASEPWHLRYVGRTLAADYRAGGFHTLEEYLGFAAAPQH